MRVCGIGDKFFLGCIQNMRKEEFFNSDGVKIEKQVSEAQKKIKELTFEIARYFFFLVKPKGAPQRVPLECSE